MPYNRFHNYPSAHTPSPTLLSNTSLETSAENQSTSPRYTVVHNTFSSSSFNTSRSVENSPEGERRDQYHLSRRTSAGGHTHSLNTSSYLRFTPHTTHTAFHTTRGRCTNRHSTNRRLFRASLFPPTSTPEACSPASCTTPHTSRQLAPDPDRSPPNTSFPLSRSRSTPACNNDRRPEACGNAPKGGKSGETESRGNRPGN